MNRWIPGLLSFVVALWPGAVVADPLPERSARIVDYDISVHLDPETKELRGSERIVWRNPSDEAVPDLWFHLYLNAFRNSESTLFREAGGSFRSGELSAESWGWTDVTALRLADGTDLLPALTFEHPDDPEGEVNEEDLTVARVVLPEPVPGGGEVVVEVEFTARLPRAHTRTGWAPPGYFLVAQWHPKLGVYEPAGMRGRETGGWNCHTFHAASEFYGEYGNYRVEITLPERFLVGATGVRVERRAAADGEVTHVYEQSDVHDFAWAADAGAVEIVETFSSRDDVAPAAYAAAASRLGRSRQEVELSDVEIHLLLQPAHRAQAARYISAAKVALETFGLAWGRYPYPTLTIVDPPSTGLGSGGMEYPTLITGETGTILGYWPLTRIHLVEAVVVHELGHQWWYGLVGSNEFEEAWLDEGFTDFAEYLAIGEYGPAGFVDLPWLHIGPFDSARAFNSLDRRYDAIDKFIWRFSPRQSGFYAYSKPALLLETLRGMLGDETFGRAMRTYAERWRFRHPSGDDFRAVVEEVSGRDLGTLFRKIVKERGAFDPAVVRVSSQRVRPRQGHFGAAGDAEDGETGEAAAPASGDHEGEVAEADLPEEWLSVIELRQLGEVQLPVEVELRFEGRDPQRRTWDGAELWARWRLTTPSRLLEVVVDPDQVYALDVSRFNNRLATESDARPATRATFQLLFWVQQLLAGVGL